MTFDHTAADGPQISGAGIVARVMGAMARFAAGMRRRRAIVWSERHLEAMPDHVLKDIGMHRSEIPAIIRFGRSEYGR